jgi:predicted RNA-binding protein with PIN domain
MIIIIDGYNFIKNIFFYVKHNVEEQRRQFITQLGYYREQKNTTVKNIIVVFDAGPFGHATREIKNGVTVMFSGQSSCADDWIVEYIEKNEHKEIVIVTNDRELKRRCNRPGIDSLKVDEFNTFLQRAISEYFENNAATPCPLGATIKKYDRQDAEKNVELDFLMEQASSNVFCKDDQIDDDQEIKKKGKSYTSSKKEKRIHKKLKKL